jgi:hypothetical protein
MVTDPYADQKYYWESPHKWDRDTRGLYRPDASSFNPLASQSGDVGDVKDWGSRGQYNIPDQSMYRTQIGSSYAQGQQARGMQESMLSYLNALATGTQQGKTVSQQAQEQSLSQIQSQATAAARAGSSPAAQRQAMYTGAAASQQGAASGAIAGMKEQQAAQQAALTGAGQMRGQDITTATAAQTGQLQASQATALQKQMEAKYLELGLTDREARRRANMAMEAMKMQAWEGQQGRGAAKDLLAYQMEQQMYNSLLGGGMAAGGALLAAFSDENCKTDIQPVQNVLEDESLKQNPNYSVAGTAAVNQPSAESVESAKKEIADAEKAKADSAKSDKSMQAAGSAIKDFGASVASSGKGEEPLGIRMGRAATERNVAATKAMFDEFVASDRSEKKNKTTVENFMDAMQAYKYRYKDPEKHGRGERIGVMAQDMEKSKLGDTLVQKDAEGTRYIDLDPRKFNPLVLAGLADLNKRLRKVEG